MGRKKLRLVVLIPWIALLSILQGRETIVIDQVNFDSLSDDWIQMEVGFSYRPNAVSNSKDSRFIDRIKVGVYLAYARNLSTREFDYYSSEVEIAIMERGDRNNVYFFLPGLIVKRDRLPTVPDFFYVEISIDGEVQEPQKSGMSSGITSRKILDSFLSRSSTEAVKNMHLLMPVYLVTGVDLSRVDNLPIFLRREVRE